VSENPNLVWIDCEMTGLSLVEDALVEIAVIVTDSELNPIGTGLEIVIKPPASALTQMSDFVRDMHITSGLLPLLESGTTLDDAQSRVLDYLKECGVESGKSPICGNSIWVDRNFIARDLPKVSEYLHYRSVDVSSIKELARRWYPRVYFNAPKKTGNHRALGDIQDSLTELRYYRAAIFTAEPGPESEALRLIAEGLTTP
jgi:oligoribonuclease